VIPIIKAISGDAEFIQTIKRKDFTGFIHSIFDKTVNIQCRETDDLYTLACNRLDNGPNSLVIDINRFSTIPIELNDQVWTKGNVLFIEDGLAVSLEGITKWECSLPTYPLNTKQAITNIASMKNHINRHGTPGGIKKNPQANNPFEIEMMKMLGERSQSLLCSLININMPEAVQHATGLIGLGPGLTPSGDDFLTGLMTTFHLPQCPCQSLIGFSEQVIANARGLTNDISYMTLKLAAKGKARESIVRLLHLALTGEEHEVIPALNEVLKIGSSSGTDIALGIVSGLEVNLKLKNKFH
jgi:hypothetical protein